MVIFAALLEIIMEEGSDMHFSAPLVVKAKLLITLIRLTIIQNSDAKFIHFRLIQNVLQVIRISAAAIANTMEVVLAHICLEEAPHAIRPLMTEQLIARLDWSSVQTVSATPNALTATMAGKYAIRLAPQALFHAVMFSVSQALSVQPLSQLQPLTLRMQSMPQLLLSNNSLLRR
jgi:hypothetical protein